MKKTILYSIIVFLAIGISFSCYANQSKQQEETIEARVDALFTEWNTSDSPGVSLAVISDGRIIYEKGYGMADLEHNIPITSESVFNIASVSKQFTAMCILLLEEEGKLSLDDDIRDYLPKFPTYDRPITIRHLIHHTSGIRDGTMLLALAGHGDLLNSIPDNAMYEILCRQNKLNFSPGEQSMYSNSGYRLLAMIVRNVSGQSLGEYAEEHIFHPLNMFSSHFHDDITRIIKNRAFGYKKNPNGGFINIYSRRSSVGSGELYTNVKDLFKWDQNFYKNQLGQKSSRLIEQMYQNGKLYNGSEVDYSFGLEVGTYRGLKTVYHDGKSDGYLAQFLRFPDQRFSVILLGNLDKKRNPPLPAYPVADIYLADFLEPQKSKVESSAAVARKESSIDPSLLDKYIGQYKLPRGNIIDITKEDNKLMIKYDGGLKSRLIPESTTNFFHKTDEYQITFQPNKKQLILHQLGVNIPAKRFKSITLTYDQLNQYAGDYYSDELQVIYTISQNRDTLYIKRGYNPKLEMKMLSDDEFFANELFNSIHFRRNEENQIIGFELSNRIVKKLKFIKHKK